MPQEFLKEEISPSEDEFIIKNNTTKVFYHKWESADVTSKRIIVPKTGIEEWQFER